MSEKNAPLDFSRKRELLVSDSAPAEKLSARGREFLARDLLDDALNFFAKAGDGEGMEEVLKESRRLGDTFTFEAAARALGRSTSRGEWEELGEEALRLGKLWFAYRAFEKGDSQDGLEKARRAMTEKGVLPPS